MYVRKFEGDTLEETLQDIKKELGPDAIILKTITNKGLKGAFKKKKIEITAAISEKNYTNKVKVDHVLTPDDKTKFYQAPASFVSHMIEDHAEHETSRSQTMVRNPGYGDMSLNRQVQTVKDVGRKLKSGLDDFLAKGATNQGPEIENVQEFINRKQENVSYESKTTSSEININEQEILKIENLERKVFELSKAVGRLEKKEPWGVFELRNVLRGFNISEKYIQELIRKALYDLKDDQLENSDVVFDFALEEMMGQINCELPLFSSLSNESEGVVTVLISETSTGQTSMAYKIGSLKSDSFLIQKTEGVSINDNSSFAEKIFDLKTARVQKVSEIYSEARKEIENNQSVFIDFKVKDADTNNVKNFVDGLRRSFKNVEILVTISAIHSELFNKKTINKYGKLANGLIVTHLDECLDFGSLFNLQCLDNRLPFKFYGNGEVIPDDIEAATPERILGGIFNIG